MSVTGASTDSCEYVQENVIQDLPVGYGRDLMTCQPKSDVAKSCLAPQLANPRQPALTGRRLLDSQGSSTAARLHSYSSQCRKSSIMIRPNIKAS